MNIEKLKERLEKAEKGLQPIIEKRKEIDKKIKEKQDEISLIKSQIVSSEYEELNKKLKENGLSIDELTKAIETQDFSKLKKS